MSELSHPLQPQPCTLVIFGGSGDLSRRKLLPALYNLFLDGALPDNYAVVGTGRTQLSDDDFRKLAREGVEKYSRQPLQDTVWPKFEQRLFWVSGALTQPQSYLDLRARLNDIEAKLNLPGGNIRNIAVNAAFLAAGAGSPVLMQHLLVAARRECNKLERQLSDSEVGGWI